MSSKKSIKINNQKLNNEELNKKELEEYNKWKKINDNEEELNTYKHLYPTLNDQEFSKKIAEKKEFNDTKYDGKIVEIEKQADILCNAEFELAPHQQFIRNFLSLQTPYNSLLLYHGLGSGKTCSAIGVAEEMREFLKQLGITQRIIVVASQNVQDNFKLQLFDKNKLKLVDGYWNIRSCVGQRLLKEINPMNMKGLPKEKVILQIKRIINNSYLFLGYTEFANYIQKSTKIPQDMTDVNKIENIKKIQLEKNFSNRLIIIDEVHNIRITDDNKDKRVAQELTTLVKYVKNIRLLLLSATPLYNSYKEIIWLLNLMNMNDNRSIIELKNVFDSNGNLKINEDGKEIGKELLERKAIGYVSFVRGENPYTFPYRIWPSVFSSENTLINKNYPIIQLNGKRILEGIDVLSLYLIDCGSYQNMGYDAVINYLKTEVKGKDDLPNFENMESFGYTLLQRPIEALNIVYPNEKFDNYINGTSENFNIKELVGKQGLNNIMTYKESTNPPFRSNFEYKKEALEKYGRIFSQEKIKNYSSKIDSICKNIINSEGVVLIYSQYLDGGLVPIALSLEEMGFQRYGEVKSLFEKIPTEYPLDLKTYQTSKGKDTIPAKYIIISGDKLLSPNNELDIEAATNLDNINGNKVKVILISQAGSEGIDFKFIRQVHILEPWYNMNRPEQIIGRAVRQCSHKNLPLSKRNVQIFLYGTILENNQEEAADLYIYRLAELKAKQIGIITRILKEVSVDCLLNIDQTNFTEAMLNQIIKQELSNGKIIDYKVGDKPYSSICDYMENCIYKCKPVSEIGDINLLSYGENFINSNNEKIKQRIRNIMKEHYYIDNNTLINEINVIKKYPLVQIYSALTQLVDDKTEFITDKYDRLGHLVNIEELYLFEPLELKDSNISLYERKVPIPYKHNKLSINLKSKNLSQDDIDVIKIIKKSSKKDKKEKDIKEKGDIDEREAKDEEIYHEKANELLMEMKNNYEKTILDVFIERGEDDWYKIASLVINELSKREINIKLLHDFIIDHIVDLLVFNDKFILLNYLYSREDKLSDFEKKIKDFFDNRIIKNKKLTGIILQNQGNQQLLILKNNNWFLSEPEDYIDLKEEISKKIIPIKNYNVVVGFITNFKKEYMVYKVKQLDKKRNKGARCDQSGKGDIIKLLNIIEGESKYNNENTKKYNSKYLCILQELLLRYYNYIKKDDKIWFLDSDDAILNNIEKVEF